jgi:AmmeMemoRadiSam system protein A
LEDASLTPHLREEGASFVTLTVRGQLRGCIGALEPYQPLAEDVREHAVAAALEDPRFPPVSERELNGIQIEVSRLTRPIPLEYKDAGDLLSKLQPHVDGVILRDVFRRATFLPQVWEKISDPAEFLDNLCYKMGASPDLWRRKHLDVLTYRVEEFRE